MVSPSSNYRAGLTGASKVSKTRADQHANSIVEAIKDELLGADGPDDPRAIWWLRPERITLTALTYTLSDRGLRSVFDTPLTPTAVDRACKRAGFDWRAVRKSHMENRNAMAEAANFFEREDVHSDGVLLRSKPKQTVQFTETKKRRRREDIAARKKKVKK